MRNWFSRPRTARPHQLAFCLVNDTLLWALAEPDGERPRLLRCGQQDWPATTPPEQAIRLSTLAPSAGQATGLLPLPAYQMLQIEAPAVPPAELRAAARWHIRDRVDAHVDDLTLDVLRVGSARATAIGHGQLFVVAAANAEVARVGALASTAKWPLRVIDVADLAQRNLHSAAAAALDQSERATACLMRHAQGCLLTICVGDELHYSRRFEWDDKLAQRAADARLKPAAAGAGLAFEDDPYPMAVELGAMADDSSRLVVELQRSFDVWERSWPDLPLALTLWHGHPGDADIADFLQEQLGMRVLALDPTAGIDTTALPAADGPSLPACTLLLGALQRREHAEA